MTLREFLENIREKLRRLFFLNVPVSKEELEEKKEELLQRISPPKKVYPHNHLKYIGCSNVSPSHLIHPYVLTAEQDSYSKRR